MRTEARMREPPLCDRRGFLGLVFPGPSQILHEFHRATSAVRIEFMVNGGQPVSVRRFV